MTIAATPTKAPSGFSYTVPQLHINGVWRQGTHAKTHTVYDPGSGQAIGELGLASAADIESALEAAQRGFEAWRVSLAHERGQALHKVAKLLKERTDQIALLLTQEQGKPLSQAKSEVASAVGVVEWYAEEARRAYGRVIQARARGASIQVVHEPIGPCVGLSPWNFPVQLATRKLAGAVAAGCSIILKAAEETPASVAAMVQCFLDAGLPAGVVQLLYGVPSEVSSQLLASPIIKKVSFTGSVGVGKLLARLAAENLQHITLELGGHAPVLIFDDANLEQAVSQLAGAKFRNAGQICASPTRFFVHQRVYSEFLQRMEAAAGALKMGHGFDPGTTLGPLANIRRQAAMRQLVDDAKARGAQLITSKQATPDQGYFYSPTVLADISIDASAMQNEPFGPLVLARSFSNEDEAIAIANNTRLGLAAYAYTDSASRQARLIEKIRSGMLALNTSSVSTPEAPFGGVGDSGYGFECGVEGLQAYMQPKVVHQFSAF